MKWFKHQSTARNDQRISELEDICGLEGYGFYFKTLEIIAESMDETSRDCVEYSVSVWAKKLNILPAKFKKLTENCEEVGLISVEKRTKTEQKLSKKRSEMYKLSSPNLLKYRDNHTKNLQATSKQEVEVDKEEEREVEIEKETPPAPKKPVRFDPRDLPMPLGLKAEKWGEWVSFRTKLPKPPKPETWEKQVEFLAQQIANGADAASIIDYSIRNGYTGLFEPKQPTGKNVTQFLTAQQQRDENNRRSTAEFLADDSSFFSQMETIEGEFTNA